MRHGLKRLCVVKGWLRQWDRRKGFTSAGSLSEGFKQIICKEGISFDEKLEQCKTLLMDSSSDLVESYEARHYMK